MAHIEAFEPVTMLQPSSNIDSVSYDADRCVARVVFKGGACYDYYGIARTLIDGWTHAQSVGKFFHKEIRLYPYLFPYREVTDDGKR